MDDQIVIIRAGDGRDFDFNPFARRHPIGLGTIYRQREGVAVRSLYTGGFSVCSWGHPEHGSVPSHGNDCGWANASRRRCSRKAKHRQQNTHAGESKSKEKAWIEETRFGGGVSFHNDLIVRLDAQG